MMSPESDHWPVVVIGAGPAGLSAAIMLARAGIRVLVVNRRTTVSLRPRATTLSLRTMELLRSWNLEQPPLRGAAEVEWQMLIAPTLRDAAAGTVVDVGLPTSAQSALISPTRPAAAPQHHLESVLLDHLRTLPSATLQAGMALEDLDQVAHGARVALRDLASGELRRVTARYVVAADGVRSLARRLLGISARESGETPADRALSVVFRAPLWSRLGNHRYGIYSVEPPYAASFLPAGADDCWTYALSGDDAAGDPTHAELIERIRWSAGFPDLPVSIESTSRFLFGTAIADRFRAGPVFLAGDAAHRVTPRGGTGLNAALADGFDLGWKLAWVLRGWAPASLLDTYEAERRPVVEHNLARSEDPQGSRRSAHDEAPRDLGGRIAHRWLDARRRVSTLDLVGTGLTHLVADPPSRRPAPAWYAGPITTRRLGAEAADALGIDPGSGLLVRPDSRPLETTLHLLACPTPRHRPSRSPTEELQMSSFLFATLPLAGHTMPALPIAAELVRRGHSVRWYTGAAFADHIAAVGATHHPMSAYDFSVTDLDAYYPERLRHTGIRRLKFDLVAAFARPIATHLADLRALLDEHAADVLIGDTGLLAGPILSEVGGPPFAVIGISVINLSGADQAPLGLGLPPTSTALGRLRNRMLNRTMGSLLFKPMYDEINRVRREHGLAATAVQPGYLPPADLTLQLGTAGSEFPRADLPPTLRFVGPPRPLPSDWERPEWWSDLTSTTKPVVLITQGTLTTDHRELLQPALEGLADDDVLVLAVTGGPDPADLGPVPANARVARFLPFDEVLPHVDAYVTNGGFGGVQLALSHGVPIIAAGKTEDKADVAARVAYTGVGLNLKTQQPTPDRVRAAVATVLADDRYRLAARQVQAEIQAAGRQERAADLLAELASRRAPALAHTP